MLIQLNNLYGTAIALALSTNAPVRAKCVSFAEIKSWVCSTL